METHGIVLFYGISMIWSRLEREIVAGREREPKTPIGTWKEAQSKRYTLEYLSKQMHKANVDIAPTMICGEISGNIEVIDVDTKHWPGIDAMYMSEINKVFLSYTIDYGYIRLCLADII